MTLVTVTADSIRAYNHAGRTEVCIAVSSAVQLAARILNAGKALQSAEMHEEPPRYEITAAIGDLADDSVAADDRIRIARQRAGRMAFVQAVFDGFVTQLQEIALMRPDALEVKDQRFRDYAGSAIEVKQAVESKLIVAG